MYLTKRLDTSYRKFKVMLLHCTLIFSLSLYSINSFAAYPTLNIGWELWYPYQYHDANSELVGLDVEIMRAVLKEANLDANFTELPWLRHLKYIESGTFDVAMGTSYSDDRSKYAYYSEAYRQETVHLFVAKGASEKLQLTTLSDLKTTPLTIGTEEGYFYGENYKRLIKQAEFKKRIKENFDIEQNVDMLLNGKIDGFLADPATVSAFVKKYDLANKFERHSLKIYSDDIYLIFSKKSVSPALFNKVNTALKALKQRGDINKILDKWRLK